MVIPVFSLARDYYAALCLQFPDRFLARLKWGFFGWCFFFFYDLHCTAPWDGIRVKNAVLRSLGALSSARVFIKGLQHFWGKKKNT